MAGNPFFSGRIPKELHDSVIKHCEETGKTKTDVLITALSNYLNIPVTETNDKTDDQINKELADLRERMQRLEDTIYKTSVITSDNNNDKGIVVTVVPQSNNVVIIDENTIDSTPKNEDRIKPKVENKEEKENNINKLNKVKRYDNKKDNIDNTKELDFKNLETKNIVEIANISYTQIGRIKNKIFAEAKSQGYSIQADIKFSPAIEAIQKRKEIIIEDIKYKLFCVGIDDKSKPIWMLKQDDNTSYQPDILKIDN